MYPCDSHLFITRTCLCDPLQEEASKQNPLSDMMETTCKLLREIMEHHPDMFDQQAANSILVSLANAKKQTAQAIDVCWRVCSLSYGLRSAFRMRRDMFSSVGHPGSFLLRTLPIHLGPAADCLLFPPSFGH